ncbi:hypothetical protein ABS767_00895 [Sphingomonas sp. ST-64]|uniref:Holin-X, holin superfamily III n=1 Tax=Sphingomonas plantiphila TaxID=3163295 RepID=A0ABW8YJX9_9SPHN
MKIDLVSPHAPIACATRLKDAVDPVLHFASPRRVTGNGTEHEMVLWVHRPNFRNDFKTMLRATMEPHAGGTRIRGRIGAPRSASVFMGCWFTFVLLFLLVGVIMVAAGAQPIGFAFVGVPALMLVMGGIMLVGGRRNGRADRDAILEFLTATIGARPYRPRDI